MRFPPGQGLISAGSATVWDAEQTFNGGAIIPSGAILSASGTGVIDSTQLGGQPATNYLRTDAGAPNPQTVANGVKIPVLRNGNAKANLLFNSTANLGLIGWSPSTSNWGASPFNGVYGNSFFNYTGSVGSNINSSFIPINPSQNYTLSGWVFNETSNSTSGFNIEYYDSTKTPISELGFNIGAGTGWTFGTVTYESPANAAYAIANCATANTQANSNIAFSRLKFEEGTTATPYSMEGDYNQMQYGTLPLAGLTGQALAGSVGVAAVVAQAQGVHVTATTAQTILSFTPSVTGLYEVKVYFWLNNGTSGNALSIFASYQDPYDSSQTGYGLYLPEGTSITNLVGSTSIGNGVWACIPFMFAAKAGTAITVTYQDPTNTPNDYVSAVITRLA